MTYSQAPLVATRPAPRRNDRTHSSSEDAGRRGAIGPVWRTWITARPWTAGHEIRSCRQRCGPRCCTTATWTCMLHGIARVDREW